MNFESTTPVKAWVLIAAEGFLVVKINEIYWFFTAISMAVLNFYCVKKEIVGDKNDEIK